MRIQIHAAPLAARAGGHQRESGGHERESGGHECESGGAQSMERGGRAPTGLRAARPASRGPTSRPSYSRGGGLAQAGPVPLRPSSGARTALAPVSPRQPRPGLACAPPLGGGGHARRLACIASAHATVSHYRHVPALPALGPPQSVRRSRRPQRARRRSRWRSPPLSGQRGPGAGKAVDPGPTSRAGPGQPARGEGPAACLSVQDPRGWCGLGRTLRAAPRVAREPRAPARLSRNTAAAPERRTAAPCGMVSAQDARRSERPSRLVSPRRARAAPDPAGPGPCTRAAVSRERAGREPASRGAASKGWAYICLSPRPRQGGAGIHSSCLSTTAVRGVARLRVGQWA